MTMDAANDPDATSPHHAGAATDPLDRAKSPYSFGEKIARVLWNYGGQIVMRLTFHDWYALRNTLLRLFGATIGKDVRIRPSATIEQPWKLSIGANTAVGDRVILYCLAPIRVGSNCTISQYAHLCAGTHDYTRPDMPLVTIPVVIEDETWIAADVFVGPGVTVGEGSVVGARSSVYKDLDPWGIYAGNPARRLRDRELRQGGDEAGPDRAEAPSSGDRS